MIVFIFNFREGNYKKVGWENRT